MMSSRTIKLLVLVCFFLPVIGCNNPEPVKIGFLASLTSRIAELGQSARDGAQLAVDTQNARGGIQGRKVELVVYDAQFDSKKVVDGVKELHSKGCVAIVGPVASQMAIAAVSETNSLRIPLVSPTVTTTDLTGYRDSFFRVYPDLKKSAASLAEYAVMKKNLKRFAVILDSSNLSFTEPWKNAFIEELNALAGEVVYLAEFDSKEIKQSYLRLVERFLKTKPDALLVLASAIDTAFICQQVRKLDSAIMIMGSDWSYAGDLLQYGGKSVEGFVFTNGVNMYGQAPEFLQFRKMYVDRFKREPNFPAVLSYEAVIYLLSAMSELDAPEELLEKLANLGEFQGLQGSVLVNEFGDANRALFINEIRDGKFHNLVETH